MRKAKLGLIASVTVGLLAVCTAGVSTYAWFQANANATVSATNNSTTITVTKPNDYAFYYYNKNGLSNYGSPVGTFASDFSAVTAGQLATVTNLDNMYPGQALTFVVSVESVTSANLKITKVKSNDSTAQPITQKRYQYVSDIDKGTEINIGSAINVYAKYYTSNTGYSTFITNPTSIVGVSDQFTCTNQNVSSYLAYYSISSNVRTL